jgi:hypothetical protein
MDAPAWTCLVGSPATHGDGRPFESQDVRGEDLGMVVFEIMEKTNGPCTE